MAANIVACPSCGRRNRLRLDPIQPAYCGACGGSLRAGARGGRPTSVPGDPAAPPWLRRLSVGWRGTTAASRVFAASAIYLSLVAALAVAWAAGPERWWWSTLALYVPQWYWLAAGGVLFGAALRCSRPGLLLVCPAMVWVAGPGMGLTVGRPAARGARDSLRVMSFNVKYFRRGVDAISAEIAGAGADLVLLQDAREMPDALRSRVFDGWSVVNLGQYVAASRFPLSGAELRKIPHPDGEPHTYLHCLLEWSGTPISVYDVHLQTPRSGLAAVREGELNGAAELAQNGRTRVYQERVLAGAVRLDPSPKILAGDLNSPPPSLVCRELTVRGMQDAFGCAGLGYGYTYGHASKLGFGQSFLRLDHIYTDERWEVAACRTGGTGASDHRPVIADLALRK